MEITCTQMDILLSFYIDEELTDTLKEKVEAHLNQCPTCRAKYNILTSIFKSIDNEEDDEDYTTLTHAARQYNTFKNNLSAYVDNELPPNESIKIKKYTINNKRAKKDLEETYRIRKLMKDSFKKSKEKSNSDFSKEIIKKIIPQEKNEYNFNPLISVGFAFVMSILLISAAVVYILSL